MRSPSPYKGWGLCRFFSALYIIKRDWAATSWPVETHPPGCTWRKHTGPMMSEDGWSKRVRSYSVRHGRIVRFFYPSQRLRRDRANFSLTFFFAFFFLFHGRDLTREEHTQKNNNFAAIVTYQYFSPRRRKKSRKKIRTGKKTTTETFFFSVINNLGYGWRDEWRILLCRHFFFCSLFHSRLHYKNWAEVASLSNCVKKQKRMGKGGLNKKNDNKHSCRPKVSRRQYSWLKTR